MERIYDLYKESIKSLGIVFGDIGTSPIYTLTVCFALIPATLPNILGVVSLILWTLILLVFVQYAWLAMSVQDREDAEGGTIVLKEVLIRHLSSRVFIVFATVLSFLGVSFFIGDGVITPAISILSAVEGLNLIPGLEGLGQRFIIIVSLVITFLLFTFQKKGTERVSMAFGPIMFIWFIILGISGCAMIVQHPEVLYSFNPYYAINFLVTNGFWGILLLSKVILCATGAEALYADLGHFGRTPIRVAWFFVFIALCLAYLGQGAFLIGHSSAHNIFYEMILDQAKILYIPLLLLSIIATVIASQAMITGIFSIAYQGMTTRIMPRLHVEYTSQKLMSQIYIPFINSFLFLFVLLAILKFKSSHNLANAYGLAASATMTITAFFLTWVYSARKDLIKAVAAFMILGVNCLFLFSNVFKIPHGGYLSLIIAGFPLLLMSIYTLGQKKLYRSLRQMPLETFIEKFNILSPKIAHIKGTAVFLTKKIHEIPTYIARTMFTNNIIYEENILVTVVTEKYAFGLNALFKGELTPGLQVFEIRAGYLEIINIEKIFHTHNIHTKVIFYGVEEISAKNFFWKVFIVIKKLTPSFVQFYKLPQNKLHGVSVRLEI